MEQILATFGIQWEVLTVQIVNFGVLLGLLWYFLYRPLLTLIEKRRTHIIEGVANAEKAEAALRDADAKRVEVLAGAGLEAETILANARMSAQAREASLIALAEEKAERVVSEAQLRAESVKRQALEESREDIARMVVLGAERLMRKNNSSTT